VSLDDDDDDDDDDIHVIEKVKGAYSHGVAASKPIIVPIVCSSSLRAVQVFLTSNY
jgi:hypothetical protein